MKRKQEKNRERLWLLISKVRKHGVVRSSLEEREKPMREVGKVKVLVVQSCSTLCDPMNCSPPGSFVHGVLQARILVR